MSMYVVYCLVKDLKPCYVGVTPKHRVSTRVKEHKALGKIFDTYLVIKEYNTKKEALIAENAIIKLHSIFDIGLVNGKILIDDLKGWELKNRYNG